MLSTLATTEPYTNAIHQTKIRINKHTSPMATIIPTSASSPGSLFVLPPELCLEVYHTLVISCLADGNLNYAFTKAPTIAHVIMPNQDYPMKHTTATEIACIKVCVQALRALMELPWSTLTLEIRLPPGYLPEYYKPDSIIWLHLDAITRNILRELYRSQTNDTPIESNWRDLTQTKRLIIQIESDGSREEIVLITAFGFRSVRDNLETSRKIKRTWLTTEQRAELTVWKFGFDYESDPAEVEGDLLMVNEKWTEKGKVFKAQAEAKL
jgi:hypothetical protein